MEFNGQQVFIILGLLLMVAELIIGIQSGFDLVLLGSILIIGGGVGLLAGSFELTLWVSIILSAVYILYGRRMIKKRIIVMTHATNIDKLPGKKAVVVRSITPDTAGMVRVDDEDWRAVADEVLYEKEKVEVETIEGVSLKVKKIK